MIHVNMTTILILGFADILKRTPPQLRSIDIFPGLCHHIYSLCGVSWGRLVPF